jgi:hypothetical protein
MMNRRHFLQLLGLSGAYMGLSMSDLARAMAVQADRGPVRRLIVISHCHGWPYASWKIRPDGLGETTSWQADLKNMPIEAFSQALAPLYAHRERMLALDGLSLATAELDMDGNRHDTGWIQAWTGNWVDFSMSEAKSWSASLDQLVATQIARTDRLPSLELSVDDVREPGRPISYGPSGTRLPVENDPALVWQRLFGPSVSPDPLAGRQRSVLEFAQSQHAALAPRLGPAQRDKLDAHYALLHGLSDRLEGMASATCATVPELPGVQPVYDQRFDVFAEMIGGAFSCDLTRVVSLSLGEMPTADFGWDHLTDDVHKGLAHEIYNDVDKHQAMTDYLTMHAEQVARLVSVLESIPEGDGSSVMDNTLIVWGSELADGWHGYQHYCPVIIGGSWHFNTGRYLYWPHETPIEMLVPAAMSPGGYSSVSGMPHQHLLVSVAQAMGLDLDHMGIEHVQGQTGQWVDCKGPLPDLT